jgi:hypothetical protein
MHSNEFIATENGFKVKLANGTVTDVINADGTLNGSAVIDDASITTAKLASNAVETAKIKDANVTLGKLATAISSSHVIKFVKLGSEITTTALTGLAVGDLVLRIVASDGTITAELCETVDTLPTDPEDLDYIIVLRATA